MEIGNQANVVDVILTTPTVRKYTLTPSCSFCNNKSYNPIGTDVRI